MGGDFYYWVQVYVMEYDVVIDWGWMQGYVDFVVIVKVNVGGVDCVFEGVLWNYGVRLDSVQLV